MLGLPKEWLGLDIWWAIGRKCSRFFSQEPQTRAFGLQRKSDRKETCRPAYGCRLRSPSSKALVQLGSGEHMEQAIRVPLGAEQWLEVSHEVVEKDPNGRLLQYFELQAVEAIDELLAQQIANNQLDESTFDPVHTAMATRSTKAMTSVATQVLSRLQSGEFVPWRPGRALAEDTSCFEPGRPN